MMEIDAPTKWEADTIWRSDPTEQAMEDYRYFYALIKAKVDIDDNFVCWKCCEFIGGAAWLPWGYASVGLRQYRWTYPVEVLYAQLSGIADRDGLVAALLSIAPTGISQLWLNYLWTSLVMTPGSAVYAVSDRVDRGEGAGLLLTTTSRIYLYQSAMHPGVVTNWRAVEVRERAPYLILMALKERIDFEDPFEIQ